MAVGRRGSLELYRLSPMARLSPRELRLAISYSRAAGLYFTSQLTAGRIDIVAPRLARDRHYMVFEQKIAKPIYLTL